MGRVIMKRFENKSPLRRATVMRVAKQAIGLNIVRAVLKSKRRTEERMMPGNCREEEKKRKKEKMKKRRKEEGCFENSFASSTMRGPPMTYVNDEKKSLY